MFSYCPGFICSATQSAVTVALQVAAYALVLLHVRPMQQDRSMLFAHVCAATVHLQLLCRIVDCIALHCYVLETLYKHKLLCKEQVSMLGCCSINAGAHITVHALRSAPDRFHARRRLHSFYHEQQHHHSLYLELSMLSNVSSGRNCRVIVILT